jgi:hypothetical protein
MNFTERYRKLSNTRIIRGNYKLQKLSTIAVETTRKSKRNLSYVSKK